MLIAIASMKGSPGVTSTALALAAVWPRQVVLLEADPAGGDLAYRCKAAYGGLLYTDRGVLTLAAAMRDGLADPDAIAAQAQLLACGVNVIPGVASVAQARGVGQLWSTIAEACQAADVDVIADLGRLDRASTVMPLAKAAEVFLPVVATTFDSVMHLNEGLQDLVSALVTDGRARIVPLLVGRDEYAGSDLAELDRVLGTHGLPISPAMPIPADPRTLDRVQEGEKATGRLSRTLLLRGARAVAQTILQPAGVL